MTEEKYQTLEDRAEFEMLFCSGANKKTVTEVLIELSGKTKVSLEHISVQERLGDRRKFQDLDILAVYKDGTAYTKSETLPNGRAIKHQYFIHRNDSLIVHVLDEMLVEHKAVEQD